MAFKTRETFILYYSKYIDVAYSVKNHRKLVRLYSCILVHFKKMLFLVHICLLYCT